MLRRGRLKKFFWKENHSFGYIQCLEEEDDIYFYACELVNDIGLVGSWDGKFEQLNDLVHAGALVEVTVKQSSRGVKAVRPMRLLPDDFEGRNTLVAQLDEQRHRLAKAWANHTGSAEISSLSAAWEGVEEESDEDAFDPEVDVWSPGGSYVRSLQEQISRLLEERAQVMKPPREPSIPNVQEFVRCMSWKNWDPCCAWKGLSCGTWPEKAKDYFGAAAFPGKAKTFVQGVSGVVAWNNNGSTYVYPKPVWTFLQNHSSYDVERVAQDMQKGIPTRDFFCQWCEKPRVVGKEYYQDQVWYCKACFLSWQGIGPRGMSDRGRLNKSKTKKGKSATTHGKKSKKAR